ncbi:MAG: M48 family metallopeptidase [Opitutaceae bacterium]|nr:M48 family metallopeptidase [Opitutaceae bacterium]
MFFRLAGLGALCLYLSSCYTVPETGRRSLNFISSEKELALGVSAFSEIKKKEKISDDVEATAMVNRVGKRIAQAVGDNIPNAEWEFVLFENESVNAFALPGGKVGIYTGLLKVADTDEKLAIVMGHEIAHVTAKHGSERMSQSILVGLGGVGLAVAMDDEDSGTRNAAMAAYGVGATLGIMLPYSRLNESEADQIGIIYAARAGYDPRVAIEFWTAMSESKEGKGGPPEMLSTHPSDATRIQRLKEFMPEAIAIFERGRN